MLSRCKIGLGPAVLGVRFDHCFSSSLTIIHSSTAHPKRTSCATEGNLSILRGIGLTNRGLLVPQHKAFSPRRTANKRLPWLTRHAANILPPCPDSDSTPQNPRPRKLRHVTTHIAYVKKVVQPSDIDVGRWLDRHQGL